MTHSISAKEAVCDYTLDHLARAESPVMNYLDTIVSFSEDLPEQFIFNWILSYTTHF